MSSNHVRRAMQLIFAAGLMGMLFAPSSASADAASFSFNWNGTPSSPSPFKPSSGFDVVIHQSNATDTYTQPNSFEAMHGSNCGPFQGFGVGGTHPVSQYQDLVFVCNNHLMTGIFGSGYGEIAIAPAQLLDWSHGTAKITIQVDTLRTSCRDWVSFNLMPFQDNLMLTDGIGVDLYHEPRNELVFATTASCPMAFTGSDIRDFNQTPISGPGGAVADVVSETSVDSAKNRQTFEIDVSRTHVRFGMPAFNRWFVDGDLASPLPYGQAVFQFAQHSYSPDKECDPTPTYCHPNTWHWSNLSMSPTVPFAILEADKFQVASPTQYTGGLPDTVRFTSPAPPNSFLRFEGIFSRGSLRFTCDGGQSWITPTHQQPSQDNPTGAFDDGRFDLMWWPVPQGCQTLTFRAADTYWSPNVLRNISIWSLGASTPVTVNAVPPANAVAQPVSSAPASAGNGDGTAARQPASSSESAARAAGHQGQAKNAAAVGGQSVKLAMIAGGLVVLLLLAGGLILWRSGLLARLLRRT